MKVLASLSIAFLLASPALSRTCGTIDRAERLAGQEAVEDASDCTSSSTNPIPSYGPSSTLTIPVVVHIIQDTACSAGAISDAMVDSQIAVLNEDFEALSGTNGGLGNFTGIHFELATEDPGGSPTSGITRSCNSTWFADGGSYWQTLAWDPSRYMNIYTNQASGNLGYVPFLPSDGGGSQVGGTNDRVVILWESFGRDAPIGSPWDLGRTATHEVGHYLGLEHTFNGGCAAAGAPACYSSGDLICDTNSEASPASSPCAVGDQISCSSVDPTDNYMDYSDDDCMQRFTIEQLRRMRCCLLSYRSSLPTAGGVFTSGFETGDTTEWSSTLD